MMLEKCVEIGLMLLCVIVGYMMGEAPFGHDDGMLVEVIGC